MSENLQIHRQKAAELKTALGNLGKYYPDNFTTVERGLEDYRRFLEEQRLMVAVIGAVKAGKSTLLNALLGDDISSTEVTPETAALTIFRKADREYVNVTFYTRTEWDELSKDAAKDPESVFSRRYAEIGANREEREWVGHEPVRKEPSDRTALKEMVKEYSSSRYPRHYFVKELEIGLKNYPLSEKICFVDTPGLNDTLAYRSNITNRYIEKAHAVVVCILAKTMRNDEMITLTKVFERIGNDKAKVIVLGTQIDTLNKIDDWEKQKAEWFQHMKNLFKNQALMERNVIGVSSWMYSLVKGIQDNETVNENDALHILTFAKRNGINISLSNYEQQIREKAEDIQRSSCIPAFLDTLLTGPLSNPGRMLNEQIAEKYSLLVEDAKSIAETLKKDVEQSLDLLNADIGKRKEAKEQKERELNAMKENETKINQRFDDIKRETESAVKNLKDTLLSELDAKIGGV